jgi:hypothetical protein
MTDNVIDLDEHLSLIEDERMVQALLARLAQSLQVREHNWFVAHAAEILAYDVLTHDDRIMDHIWYLRHVHGEAILEWARTICPNALDKEDEEDAP